MSGSPEQDKSESLISRREFLNRSFRIHERTNTPPDATPTHTPVANPTPPPLGNNLFPGGTSTCAEFVLIGSIAILAGGIIFRITHQTERPKQRRSRRKQRGR